MAALIWVASQRSQGASLLVPKKEGWVGSYRSFKACTVIICCTRFARFERMHRRIEGVLYGLDLRKCIE